MKGSRRAIQPKPHPYTVPKDNLLVGGPGRDADLGLRAS